MFVRVWGRVRSRLVIKWSWWRVEIRIGVEIRVEGVGIGIRVVNS